MTFTSEYKKLILKIASENGDLYKTFRVLMTTTDGSLISPRVFHILSLLSSEDYFPTNFFNSSEYRLFKSGKADDDIEFPFDEYVIKFLETKKSEIFKSIEERKDLYRIMKDLVFIKGNHKVNVSIQALLKWLGKEYDLVYENGRYLIEKFPLIE